MLFSSFIATTSILALLASCSSSCPDNEIESECVNPCNTCELRHRCDPPRDCQPGCDCKPGFSRDESGSCVPEQQCLAKSETPRCPPNALYSTCAPPNLPTCENPHPEPDEDEECAPGCVCRTGLLARKDGQCVTPDQCHSKETPSACQEDEEYYECTPSCKNTCENFNNPGVKCPCGPPGCFCREGLVKREDGKCVHPKQCPKSPTPNDPASECPKNAIFIQCGSPCPPTCDYPQPEPCEEKCITACYCKPGYLKRRDGVCVKPADCHARKKPEPKCPENAIFIECGSRCPPTCEDRFPTCEENCTRACFCKPGFLLKTGQAKCVKPENCDASTAKTATPDAARCPTNEVPSDCVIPCNDCKIKGTCKFFACNKGCDCKKGYFRNKDGKCILASECPEITPPRCPTNEEPSDCVIPCNDCIIKGNCKFFVCNKGCDCKKGYFRNKDGKCILAAECPETTDAARCPTNEVPSDCVIPCNDCKIRGTCKFFACNKGCDCKKGYFRNKDGKCILASECPETMEPQPKCARNEQFYECTPSCKNTCENIHNPGVKCQCGSPGCFCKEGLVKRKDGKCVPPEKCEALPPPECGEDQTFYNCTPGCKNTCEHFFNPAIRCGCGPPGCFCKEGLIKRADGKCILPNQCPAIKPASCPENAEFSDCGPSCRSTCRDPYPAACSGHCVRGCFCKSGFVEDTDGRCVRLKDCSKKCLLTGEEFQECGSTCPNTCENRGHPPPGSCPYRCNRGCFCKKGLYRSTSGQCVLLKVCDRQHHFETTSKPTLKEEKTDAVAATVTGDSHGCPDRKNCDAFCKSLGDYTGFCTGPRRLHCRCT